MNPDLPGLVASTRLAEVWPCEPSWRWWWPLGGGLPAQWFHTEGETNPAVPARSIGEMGEEIRRRGWGCAIDATKPESGTEVQVFFGNDVAIADEDRLADALALALSEAIEEENK